MPRFVRAARPIAVVLSAVLLFAAGADDERSAGVRADVPTADAPAADTAVIRADAPADAGASGAGSDEPGGHDDHG